MSKVYDCFIYFNEIDLLKIRFRELADTVDFFVLIEGSLTHTGYAKPFYFQENRHLFKEYAHKIVDRGVTLPKDNANTWGRETVQRTAFDYTLCELAPADDDIIMVSDVDEIINPKAIEAYRSREDVCCLEQKTYHYNLNCQLETPTIDPKIARYRQVKEIGGSDLRYYDRAFSPHVLKDAGWHLSFMGGTDKIIEKMKSYSHYDERDPNTPVYLSRENVEASIKEGKSLFMRDDVKYLRVKDYSNIPRYIRENFQSFVEKGWIVDP